MALLLNQDGDPPDHAEQARRRYLKIDKPGRDGLSRIHGLLDPEAVATLEPGFAKLGAPGMCNPDDHTPCIDRPPDNATIRSDTRIQGQRPTMRSKRWPVRCWRQESWANSTGYPPPSS